MQADGERACLNFPRKGGGRSGKAVFRVLNGQQLRPDSFSLVLKIICPLEVPPGQKVFGVTALGRGKAFSRKMQADGVQHRGHAGFKGVPVPVHQAHTLFVADHQGLGGVLHRQMLLDKACICDELHL